VDHGRRPRGLPRRPPLAGLGSGGRTPVPAEGISAFPFPFTEEGRDVGAATRAAVPFDALLDLNYDIAQQTSAAVES
jgi:hypothetical protein